jgi:tetratricopeptide (TPR) repeat protein
MGQAFVSAPFLMPWLRLFGLFAILFAVFLPAISLAQGAQGLTSATNPAQSLKKGTELVKQGHCGEALPLLKKAYPQVSDKSAKRDAGLAGVRCGLFANQPDATVEFLRLLNRDFPRDPDVLYVSVHAYSDLSTRAAQELARSAPNSYPAHELNAESLELQGKWDEAAKEYQQILKQNPDLPGIHFRLGRLLLSKPNPPPDVAEQARKEFEEELKIEPANPEAEYVLGELARQAQQWDEAVQHFSRASKLDAGFGDAFLGLGEALIASRKFSEAIPPLETAAKLEPANPGAHYNLATAYSRAGRKAEADREFAIHRQMTQKGDGPSAPAGSPPENPN